MNNKTNTESKNSEKLNKQLTFYAPTKQTLNANRMPNHYMVKSNIASYLRTMGQKAGIEGHHHSQAAERLEAILVQEQLKTEKSRSRKRMNKAGETDEVIQQKMTQIEKDLNVGKKPEEIQVPYLFEHFTIKVTVFSLTKGRIDPPNFYPTIKHIIDGLTDASWWEDDNFDQLVEMSFVYGGVTDLKGEYKFVLDIQETEKVNEQN